MLRHSLGTHLPEDGDDLSTAQALLGHQSLKRTTIHTHVLIRSGKRIYSPVDNLRGGQVVLCSVRILGCAMLPPIIPGTRLMGRRTGATLHAILRERRLLMAG